MKKLNFLRLVIAGVAMTALLVTPGCKKEAGPQGPAGPTGPQGPQGNANVQSSSLTSSNWNYVAPSYEMALTYGAITQDILDKGAVLVYVNSGSNYYQLPYTFYPSSSYSRTYTYVHYLGGLKVFVTDSDLTNPGNPGSLTLKVVVVASSGLVKHPNVNFNNYEEVKAAFGLND